MRFSSRLLATLLLLSLPSLRAAAPAWAQVNIEKMRTFTEDGQQLALDGSLAFRSGNSDLFEVGLGSRFDYRRGRHYTFLVGSVRYGERNDQAYRNRSFAHLRYTFYLTDRVATEAFTQVEHDGFTLLNLRLLGGLGLRLSYFDQEGIMLAQGTALMPELERLQADRVVEHPAHTEVLRWSNYINLRLQLTKLLTLINTVYLQPRLGDFGDVRVLDDAALEVELTRHLSLTTTLNLRYDSRPPDDIAALDVYVSNGLRVRF